MTEFVGCQRADEVSVTRGAGSAANSRSVKLLIKNRSGGEPATPSSENIDMTAEELKKALADATATAQTTAVTKILGMTDVTKAHYLALTDDAARTAFLAKSAEDMNAEATAAKTAIDTEKARTEALASSGNQAIADIIKAAVAPLVAQVTDLQKQLGERAAADVFKTRAAAEFAGHPQGEAFVVDTLKSIASLPVETQKSIEATLTSAINLAKFAGLTNVQKALGVETPTGGAEAAMTQLKTLARDLKKSVAEVSEMPEYAHLHEQAMQAG